MKELCEMYSLSFQFCLMQCIKNKVIISRCDMECTNLIIAGSKLDYVCWNAPKCSWIVQRDSVARFHINCALQSWLPCPVIYHSQPNCVMQIIHQILYMTWHHFCVNNWNSAWCSKKSYGDFTLLSNTHAIAVWSWYSECKMCEKMHALAKMLLVW